ncbi:MAG: ABC transporter ATP-binding protein [Steroidobacteraceae bacterium]
MRRAFPAEAALRGSDFHDIVTNPDAVEIRGLRFGWPGGAPLLAIENFAVGRGERVLLQGASGSGKSTLLALIGGVLQPHRGKVMVLGHDLAALGSRERDRLRGASLGFIFQLFNLLPYLNVLDNVMLPLRFSRQRRASLAGQDPRAEAVRLLESLGIASDLHDRIVTQLSIGQQQRVASARSLIGAPALVIADEPTSALDHKSREDFLRTLGAELLRQRASLLFVSHDPGLGANFDRIVTMDEINSA